MILEGCHSWSGPTMEFLVGGVQSGLLWRPLIPEIRKRLSMVSERYFQRVGPLSEYAPEAS